MQKTKMIIKVVISVTTPKGKAKGTETLLRKILLSKLGRLSFRKIKFQTWTNDDDSQFFWELDEEPHKIQPIVRNVTYYDKAIKELLGHKYMRTFAGQRLSKDELKEYERLLTQETKVEVLKTTELEVPDDSGVSFWERIKRTFKRSDDQ